MPDLRSINYLHAVIGVTREEHRVDTASNHLPVEVPHSEQQMKTIQSNVWRPALRPCSHHNGSSPFEPLTSASACVAKGLLKR